MVLPFPRWRQSGPIVAQTITVVAAAHDTYDQIWGWSQFGGAIVAVVALVVAWWSRRDAKAAAKADGDCNPRPPRG